MLANGNIPMLKSTTTSADSRHTTAASAGDVLSHPNDRRNSAASGTADSNKTVGRGTDSKMNDYHHRDHDRGSSSSTVISSTNSFSSGTCGHTKRLLVSGAGLPKKGGNAESFNHWGPDPDHRDERYHEDRYNYGVVPTTGSRDRVLAATTDYYSPEPMAAAERGAQSMGSVAAVPSKPSKDGATFSIPGSASAASRDMEEPTSKDIIVAKIPTPNVSRSYLAHEGNGSNHIRQLSSGEHLGQRAVHPPYHRNHHGDAGRIGIDADDNVEVQQAFHGGSGATAGLGEDYGRAKVKARETAHYTGPTVSSKKRKERNEEEADTGAYSTGIGMDRADSPGSPRRDHVSEPYLLQEFTPTLVL